MKNNIISTNIILSKFSDTRHDIDIVDIIRTQNRFDFRVIDNSNKSISLIPTRKSYLLRYDSKTDKLHILDFDDNLLSLYDKYTGIKSKISRLSINDIESRIHGSVSSKVRYIFESNNYNKLILDEFERLDYSQIGYLNGNYSLIPDREINFEDALFVKDCLNSIVENHNLYYTITYNDNTNFLIYSISHIKEYKEDLYINLNYKTKLKTYLNTNSECL